MGCEVINHSTALLTLLQCNTLDCLAGSAWPWSDAQYLHASSLLRGRPSFLFTGKPPNLHLAECHTLPFLQHLSYFNLQNVAIFTLESYVIVLYVRGEVDSFARVWKKPQPSMLVYGTFHFMFKLKSLSVFVTKGSFKPWILLLCERLSSKKRVRDEALSLEGCWWGLKIHVIEQYTHEIMCT